MAKNNDHTDMHYLEIEIDRLTNSILCIISGVSFDTEMSEIKKAELQLITKKVGWLFNWKKEFNTVGRKIFKLTVKGDERQIHGLLSITIMDDHVHLNIAESAPFNRGEKKEFVGVGGNLFAFACKQSFDRGDNGIVAFIAKTKLIRHYEETLGAERINGQKMVILPEKALLLINKYFNN